MPLLSKLFGGGSKEPPQPTAIEYAGFRIYPDPVSEDGGFRLAARIEMGEGESLKTHNLIRADVIRDRDQAVEAAVAKAKQMIDQMGARIFT
jgi:hypothetical protein